MASDWKSVKRTGADDVVLDKLNEAAALYEAYLQVAAIHSFPEAADVEPDVVEPPYVEQPIGIALNLSPTGIAIYDRA